ARYILTTHTLHSGTLFSYTTLFRSSVRFSFQYRAIKLELNRRIVSTLRSVILCYLLREFDRTSRTINWCTSRRVWTFIEFIRYTVTIRVFAQLINSTL